MTLTIEISPRQIFGQLAPPITIDGYGALPAAHNRTVVFDGTYYRVVYKHAIFGGDRHDVFYATIDRFGILKRIDRIGFTENLIIYGLDMYSYLGSTEILLGYAHGSYLRARTGTISGETISWSSPTSSSSRTNPRTAVVVKSTDGYYWFEEYYPHQSNKGNSLATIFGSACLEFTSSYEITAQYARLPDSYVLIICSDYNDAYISWYRHKQNACGSQNNFASKTQNYHLMGKLGLTEDGNGGAHAIYEDTSGYLQYKKYTYSSNSWSNATQLDDDVEYCTIGVDADNTIYVLWTRPSPDNNIYCKIYKGNWSSKLTAFTESSHPTSISCEHRSPRIGTLGMSWALGNEIRFGIYPPIDGIFHVEKNW